MRNLALLVTLVLLPLSCSDKQDSGIVPDPKPNVPAMPLGFRDSVRIVALCPNPIGNDDRAEWFAVANFGPQINLKDWHISDNEGVRWSLDSINLNRYDTVKITSDKTAQLLNSGDTVSLYNNSILVQRITYGTEVKEGDTVVPR